MVHGGCEFGCNLYRLLSHLVSTRFLATNFNMSSRYIVLVLLIFSSFFFFNPCNAFNGNSCEKVIIYADADWKPYSYYSDETQSWGGIGIDIMQLILGELDVPYEIKNLTDQVAELVSLEYQNFDFIVASFDSNMGCDFLRGIAPNYSSDGISIITRTDMLIQRPISVWSDLMGLRGLASKNFIMPRDWYNNAKKYLYIQNQMTLDYNFKDIIDRKADYLIGSTLQLEGLFYQLNDQQRRTLSLVKINHNNPYPVYLSANENSSCRIYIPFIKSKLAKMQRDGVFDEKIQENTANIDKMFMLY